MKKIIIAALLLSLLTGLLVYNFAKNLEKLAKPEYTEVVVTTKPILDRTIITADMLMLKDIPSEAVLETAIKDPAQAIGYISAGFIEQGEIVTVKKIHIQGDRNNNLGYFIPEGKRAITIEVDKFAGVGGFILPGDRVDMIVTMVVIQTVDGIKESASKSFLLGQDIEVLASGINTKVDSNLRNTVYNSVTLAVSPDEALSIALASSGGKIRLVLRSGSDREIIEREPISAENITQ